jgi:hypothetical protein
MGWFCCKDWRWWRVRESHLAKELTPAHSWLISSRKLHAWHNEMQHPTIEVPESNKESTDVEFFWSCGSTTTSQQGLS